MKYFHHVDMEHLTLTMSVGKASKIAHDLNSLSHTLISFEGWLINRRDWTEARELQGVRLYLESLRNMLNANIVDLRDKLVAEGIKGRR